MNTNGSRLVVQRPFRFGVVYATSDVHPAWADFARTVERLGFSTLLVADHYDNGMGCIPLLAAAAAVTTTLRIGSYVFDNDFRHPAMLAKEVGTIDSISGGRMELGIGAGWLKSEYDRVGLTFDPGRIRVDRLIESVKVLRGLLAGDTVDFDGEHYRIHGQPGIPASVQHPLPMLIGGGGPRMIRFAAREADIVGFVPPAKPEGGLDTSAFSTEHFESKVAHLDQEMDEIARPRDELERSILLFAVGTSSDHEDEDGWIEPQDLARSPYALFGTPEEMAETLIQRREQWGLSYIVCYHNHLDLMAPVVELLARQ
jgi:probable F420-dependent oxidoreductase